MAELVALAEATFSAADPISHAQVTGGSIAPTPIRRTTVAPVREALAKAWSSSQSIKADLLPERDRALLRAIRFGLNRTRDQLTRFRPWRTDPCFYLHEADRLLDELERERALDSCRSCPQALEQLALEIAYAHEQLGATSLAQLDAAVQLLAVLEKRVVHLEPSAAGDRVVEALAAWRVDLERARPRLAAMQPVARTAEIPPAHDGQRLQRLDDRLDASFLRRLLEVEENVTTAAAELSGELGNAIGRLRGLLATHEPGTSGARGLDLERCRERWAAIASWTATQPALAGAGLQCDVAIARLGDRSRDDRELSLALIELGVVEPTRRARREKELPALALLYGRSAPHSHRLALSVGVASGMKDDPLIHRALSDAIAELCLARTALWIHGHLGDDDRLRNDLAKYCSERPPDQWIAAAEADPRQALRPLGLNRLASGPADIVALERFWWVPLGLIDILVTPAKIDPPGGSIEWKPEPIAATTAG